MKSLILMLGAFLLIGMYPALNTAWANDPIPRSRTLTYYEYDRGKSGRAPTQKGPIHSHKAKLRYEKARRLAWADGKLTYRERRRRHDIRTLPEKGINRHRGNHLPYTRGHINKKHKQYFIPRFSIGFSFSKPWIH